MIDYDFGSEPEQRRPVAAAQDAPASAPWKILVYALFGSRRLIVFAFVVGGLLGFVRAALQLNTYQSSGKLLVRSGAREAATPESDVASGMGTVLASTREAVSTELHLLQNSAIIDRVVKSIGAARILEFRDPAADDVESTSLPTKLLHQFQSWRYAPPEGQVFGGVSTAAARNILYRGLYPRAAPGSTVIDVSYQGQNPEICRDVVNAFFDAAVEHHREIFAATRELDLTRERESQAREESLAATKALAKFHIATGVYNVDMQKNALLENISAVEIKQLTDAGDVKKLRRQLAFLDSRIEEEKKAETEQALPVINPVHVTFEQRLYDLRLRKMDFGGRPGELSPDTEQRRRALDDLIKDTAAALAQTNPNLPAVDTRRDQLVDRRDDLLESLAALEGVSAGQAKHLQELRDELARVQQAEPEYLRLFHNVDQGLSRVDAAVRSLERLSLMSTLDERELSNLRILQRATYNVDKIGPSRSRFLMFGGLLGLALGMAVAMARAVLDARLRRPSELASKATCAILGVQPALSRKVAARNLCEFAPGASPYHDLIDSLWSGMVPKGPPEAQVKIAFVGENPNVGCSTVAACAGIGLAERLGAKVIVIETSHADSGLAELFGFKGSPGLSDVLNGKAHLEEAILPTPIPGLSILPAGGGSGMVDPGRFASSTTKKILAEAGQSSEYVLFDMASVVRQPEVRPLLWDVSSVVVVASGGQTRKDRVKALAGVIRGSGARILGAVFNRYCSVRPGWLPGPDGELTIVQSKSG